MERVLVIDDDVELFGLVARFLSGEGLAMDSAVTGAEGLVKCRNEGYSIILLDVMLPDTDGFAVLRDIRAESRTPVLMLTARGETLDRVRGLELGADDYLAKPFDPAELLARIRAILRRVQRPSNVAIIAVEDVVLDAGGRTVRCKDEPVDLTSVEFDLLSALLRSAGTTLSRETLVRDVLGREFSPFDRSIDTHVYHLRRKLGPRDDGSERIKGIRGTGYFYATGRQP